MRNSIRAIMLAREERQLTEAAIAALADELAEHPSELVVVEHGGGNGHLAASVARRCREVQLRIQTAPLERSYAAIVNSVALGATTDLLLLIDNDTEIGRGALHTMLADLEEDPRVAAVGPKLLYPTGEIEQAGLSLPLWLVPTTIGRNAPANDQRYSFPRTALAVSTSCLLVRRVAFDKIGGLVEAYDWGYEAIDLSLSLRKRRCKVVYEPRATCIHHGGRTLRRFPALSQVESNRRLFLERWGDEVLGQVGAYLDGLGDQVRPSFYIYGTGESALHLANTLEIGGYRVAGLLSGDGARPDGRYPTWGMNDAPTDPARRILIGTPAVAEAEDALASAGLLAGAALPILMA